MKKKWVITLAVLMFLVFYAFIIKINFIDIRHLKSKYGYNADTGFCGRQLLNINNVGGSFDIIYLPAVKNEKDAYIMMKYSRENFFGEKWLNNNGEKSVYVFRTSADDKLQIIFDNNTHEYDLPCEKFTYLDMGGL